MRDFIYMYMKEPGVTVLGPGKRFVLWVQGCNGNCPGCIAENAKNMESGIPIKIDALACEMALSDAEGITISGGEPFLQAEELSVLLEKTNRRRRMGTIVFTGYRYEDISSVDSARKLLSWTDLLIDGPYVSELDNGTGLRGSSNQRLLFLTDVYKDCEKELLEWDRKKELFLHGAYAHEVGIPKHGKY